MSSFVPAFLIVALLGSQQPGSSLADFRAADEATKLRMLGQTLMMVRAPMPIADFIVLARVGLGDASAKVRIGTVDMVMGRAMVADSAGTPFAAPGQAPVPGSNAPIIPAELKGDRQTLREALGGACLALLRTDVDDRVRHEALLLIGTFERPSQRGAPWNEAFIALLVDLFRQDPSPTIRAEVVKTFRLVPNNGPEMRAVLRDALVDPNATIRAEAIGARRLSFEEARDTVVAALTHADPSVRLGAVRALNEFGAPAAPYIQTLERMSANDPDAQVKASARLAIEAIQRSLRRGGRL